MKANLTKLNNLKQKLQEKLEAMEWAIDERSERWHESEAAQIHEDKINALDGAITSIEYVIDELSEVFNIQDLF